VEEPEEKPIEETTTEPKLNFFQKIINWFKNLSGKA